MNTMLKGYITEFENGRDLRSADAEMFLDALITETDESLIADLLTRWNEKGICEDEIYSIANTMRKRMVKVNSRYAVTADIVGTGGSKAKTFNVSTASAFVVAAAGVPVAKHGNRAATSNSGSADVLDRLGIAMPTPEAAEAALNEHGICFMFAPNHHRLSPTLGRVRRSLGFPTVFNCVGPLCNPASAPHQLIGVWNSGMVMRTANALARLGTKRSWVVNGYDRLDELMLEGTTTVAAVSDGSVTQNNIAASDLGLGDLAGDLSSNCTATESAELIAAILDGEMEGRDAEKLVLLNSAAALHIAGRAADLKNGLDIARTAIRNGAAKAKLEALRQQKER